MQSLAPYVYVLRAWTAILCDVCRKDPQRILGGADTRNSVPLVPPCSLMFGPSLKLFGAALIAVMLYMPLMYMQKILDFLAMHRQRNGGHSLS
eukprot:4159604-Amphidinium_carterae.1